MIDGLLIDRKELLNALTTLRRNSGAKGKTLAYLYYELGHLKIQAGRARVTVKAEGAWPQAVSVSAVMFARASLSLPKKDPLLLQFVLGNLYIDTLSFEAKKSKVPSFTEPGPTMAPAAPAAAPAEVPERRKMAAPATKRDALSFPPNASSKHLLLAALERSPEELAMAGLTGRVEKATMERNRRITKALDQLSLYGVKHSDLVALVEGRLKAGTSI